jgi:hypothetical protein
MSTITAVSQTSPRSASLNTLIYLEITRKSYRKADVQMLGILDPSVFCLSGKFRRSNPGLLSERLISFWKGIDCFSTVLSALRADRRNVSIQETTGSVFLLRGFLQKVI